MSLGIPQHNMFSIRFGDFILPETTTIEKHEKIGNALRSYHELNKLVQAVDNQFPFLIVGGLLKTRITKPAVE